MRDLTVVGLSEDRAHVVLASTSGEEFRVPLDERLRATLRYDRARLGQLENDMDSALRPRDIQARIRRGESPEAVAEAAQVSVERIMGYAVPVLAEREHTVERARGATLRRRYARSDAGTLGDAVDDGMRDRGQDPDTATWDSWRREDGRWTVVVRTGEETQGQYTFDAPGRFVVADDEPSRILIGDVAPGPDATDMAIASAVSGEQLPQVPDEAPAEGPTEDEEQGVTSLKRARARRALAQEQLTFDQGEDEAAGDADAATRAEDTASPEDSSTPEAEPGDASREPTVDLSETVIQDEPTGTGTAHETASQEDTEAPEETAEAPPPRKQRGSKRRERRHVPSWDEIMFGDKNS